MTREERVETREEREKAIDLLDNLSGVIADSQDNDYDKALRMGIQAIKTVEDFERAQIIMGGRLNGRTYAYKCGLEDGKRKALEKEPSEDCVSRDAVDHLCFEFLKANSDTNIAFYEHFRDLPSVTPKQNWIPVDKELPKENVCDDGYVEPSDYVLVCGNCGNYGVSRYWGNRKSKAENPNSYKDWMDLDWVAHTPIAWMPLPPSYKGE